MKQSCECGVVCGAAPCVVQWGRQLADRQTMAGNEKNRFLENKARRTKLAALHPQKHVSVPDLAV